jgi:tRNA modification GTPase
MQLISIFLIVMLSFVCSYLPRTNVKYLGHQKRFSSLATDTIFALSTGPIVKSGIAVVRISGPQSEYCLNRLLSTSEEYKAKLEPRKASLRRLYSPSNKEVLDQALVLWFPAPHSFTGEDVVELHVHGSKAVIKGIFEAMEHLDNPSMLTPIRPAGPGEFTRRAFDNGRMDLTEVEGLSDLLDAETSEQRKQALRQMDGHLRVQYETWRYCVTDF